MPPKVDQNEIDSLRLVCRKIEQSIDEAVKLDDLAKLAGMNTHRLTDLFLYFVGHTIEEYHILIRMGVAVRLLTETNDSITDIAYMVGYANVRSFGKEFKKHTHFTASEYRRKYRSE